MKAGDSGCPVLSRNRSNWRTQAISLFWDSNNLYSGAATQRLPIKETREGRREMEI